MSEETKPVVSKESTFDLLDIRLGRVTQVELEPGSPKKAYKLTIDFGRFGVKTSVGRFTQHAVEDLKGKQVLGVLNFGSRKVGDTLSEVLVLGVQYPKAESGEATFVTSAVEAKIGSKLF
jgi:tRNA-binding protein